MASEASTAIARVTQAALARELGVSRQAIGDLVRRGILTLGQDGKLDLEMARVAIASRLRPSSKASQAVDPPPQAAAPANDATVGDDAAITSYHVAKTLREAAEARRAQLKLQEEKGALIRADAVRTALANIVAATRDNLMQIPARLAPVLAVENDPAKVHDLLRDELRQALARLLATPSQFEQEADA